MKQRLEEARKKCMRILEKQFWNQIRSYFVKRGECSDMVNWLKDKSLTGRLMFKSNPELRGELLGGKFWTSGYYVNTVGRYGSEAMIRKYVQEQGKEKTYEQIHKSQLSLL